MLQVVRKHKRLQAGTRPRRVGAIKSLRGVPLASAAILTGATVVAGVAALSVLSLPAQAVGQAGNSVELTANVSEPGLSVTLPNGSSATLNLAPPFSGYSSDSTIVAVSVSSRNDYKLYMSGDTSLTDGNGNNIPTLDTSCNTTEVCSITDDTKFGNAWGYSIATESNNYYGLQTAASTLVSNGTGSANPTTYQIKFGAKVDHTVTPGTYTGTVNFIAVADVNSNIYMQYMTSNQCTTTASTVYDVRDGKSYKIQKLADNKCWMLDNLALDPTNSNTIVNEYNTNASATTLAILEKGVYNETTNPSGVNLEDTGLDNTSGKYASSGIMANPNTTATYPYWGKGDTESSNNCDSNPNTCTDNWTVPRINVSKIPNETNPDNPVAYQYPAWSPNSTSENHDSTIPSYGSYNIGVYYNYCAASAGSYCYGSGNAPTTDPQATEDICPSGWRLPTGDSGGEFRTLYDLDPSYAAQVNGINGYRFRAALATPNSGRVDSYSLSGAVISVGTYGGWWSSTRYSGIFIFNLDMDATTNLGPSNVVLRSGGLTVRCVLNQS